MKVLGLKEVAIEKLSLPGDMKTRRKSDSVKELGQAIEATDGFILHDPVVRKSDMKLLAGRDRIAAKLNRGEKFAIVKYVECDDAEALAIELAENAGRRHDPKKKAEQFLRMMEATAKQVAPEVAQEKAANPSSRKTPKKAAREKVARSRGVKPEAVRKAEQRAKAVREDRAPAPRSSERPPKATKSEAPIATLGIAIEPEWLVSVGRVQEELTKIADRVATALSGLTVLRKSKLPIDDARIAALWDGLHGIGESIRGAIPKSICPWCKGLPGIQDQCQACDGNGYITASVKDIPKELLDMAHPVVAVKGKYVAETVKMEGGDAWS